MLIKKYDSEDPAIYQIYVFGTHDHQIDNNGKSQQQQSPNQSQCSSVAKKSKSEIRLALTRKILIVTFFSTKAKKNLDETSQDKLIDSEIGDIK